MKINNIDVDFSVTNSDDLESFNKAEQKCSKSYEKASELMESGKMDNVSKGVSAYIDATRVFFDDAFGAGTSEKVFKDSKEAMLYIKTLAVTTKSISEQVTNTADELNEYKTVFAKSKNNSLF